MDYGSTETLFYLKSIKFPYFTATNAKPKQKATNYHHILQLLQPEPDDNRSWAFTCSKGKSFYFLHGQNKNFQPETTNWVSLICTAACRLWERNDRKLTKYTITKPRHGRALTWETKSEWVLRNTPFVPYVVLVKDSKGTTTTASTPPFAILW